MKNINKMSFKIYFYKEDKCIFRTNIHDNLKIMADKAGVYYHLYNPGSLGMTKPKDLILGLQRAIEDVEIRPDYYKQFDSKIGFCYYKHFVFLLKNYLRACIKYSDCEIKTCN